jgi:hypothetical protein
MVVHKSTAHQNWWASVHYARHRKPNVKLQVLGREGAFAQMQYVACEEDAGRRAYAAALLMPDGPVTTISIVHP